MKQYLVLKLDGHWSVLCGGLGLGPYIGREAAIASAVNKAKADFSNSIKAMVMVDDDGQLTSAYDSTLPG